MLALGQFDGFLPHLLADSLLGLPDLKVLQLLLDSCVLEEPVLHLARTLLFLEADLLRLQPCHRQVLLRPRPLQHLRPPLVQQGHFAALLLLDGQRWLGRVCVVEQSCLLIKFKHSNDYPHEMSRSFNKHIHFVQFLDVGFDVAQLLLVGLLPALEASRVHQLDVRVLLVLLVHLVPLPLQPLSDVPHLVLGKAVPG